MLPHCSTNHTHIEQDLACVGNLVEFVQCFLEFFVVVVGQGHDPDLNFLGITSQHRVKIVLSSSRCSPPVRTWSMYVIAREITARGDSRNAEGDLNQKHKMRGLGYITAKAVQRGAARDKTQQRGGRLGRFRRPERLEPLYVMPLRVRCCTT